MSLMPLKRRDLLAGCGVLVLMPTVVLAQPTPTRRLHLRNEHTGETFNGTSFHTNLVDLIEGCSRDNKIPQTL